jgi:hypothetical protein
LGRKEGSGERNLVGKKKLKNLRPYVDRLGQKMWKKEFAESLAFWVELILYNIF